MALEAPTVKSVRVIALYGEPELFPTAGKAIAYIKANVFSKDELHRIEVSVHYGDGTELAGSGSSHRMIQLLRQAAALFND